MPKTIEKVVYSYEEMLQLAKDKKISEHALEKARSWLIEGQTDVEWWDGIYDMWKEALEQIGFEDAEINFSGFCCQGDGASFTCKNVNVNKLIKFMSAKTKPTERVQVVKGK